VIQQGSGKVLTLLAQFLILVLPTGIMITQGSVGTSHFLTYLEFMLEKAQASQFPGQLKGRQNGIL